jgi:hypothetical protein
MKKSESMGVLAFGSLLNDPGCELLGAEVQRISVRTPFPVEFARYSRSRRGAPTLVPVSKENRGRTLFKTRRDQK